MPKKQQVPERKALRVMVTRKKGEVARGQQTSLDKSLSRKKNDPREMSMEEKETHRPKKNQRGKPVRKGKMVNAP